MDRQILILLVCGLSTMGIIWVSKDANLDYPVKSINKQEYAVYWPTQNKPTQKIRIAMQRAFGHQFWYVIWNEQTIPISRKTMRDNHLSNGCEIDEPGMMYLKLEDEKLFKEAFKKVSE